MICAGIDAGSRAIKIAIVCPETLTVLATGVADQGVAQEKLTIDLFERLLGESGMDRTEVVCVVATGYGRNAVGFAGKTITEITCHAVGVCHFIPGARTVIDIGGQDSKFIRIDDGGGIADFVMNDRCAAGTGCFLEMVAGKLGVSLESLGALAKRSRKPAAITNTCAVFAETEIIGLLAAQTPPADIVAGVQASIAARISSMTGRDIASPVVFAGGVALIGGMDTALQTVLGKTILIAPQPQMTGAIGAAILAARRLKHKDAECKGSHRDQS